MHLYAFGSNGAGQLAIGHMDDVDRPARCLFAGNDQSAPPVAVSLASDCPMRIIAGGNHTLLRLPSGAVYAAGSNLHGECAASPITNIDTTGATASTPQDNLLRFQRVVITDITRDGNQEIALFSHVSATWSASFFVGVDGTALYAVGHGARGELGLGPGVTESKAPTRVSNFPPDGTHIVSIASGMGHTVVLLDDGAVFGWGGARKGQLGASLVGEKVVWSPQRIMVGGSASDRVQAIACGREFTVASSSSDPSSSSSLHVFGPDKWTIVSAAPPTVAGHTSLMTSWHGVYVHLADGKVLAWGRNDRGQLPSSTVPPLSQIAVGSEHCIGAINRKTLVAFGWGEHGNCGPEVDNQGNVVGRWNEITLPSNGSSIEAVGAGCATSWVMLGKPEVRDESYRVV